MSKNKRTHGDKMATYGELNGLYTTIVDLQRRIKILEAIRQKDEKQEERVNETR